MTPPAPSDSQKTSSLGATRRAVTDVYHLLLTSSWWTVFADMLCLYFGANAAFALFYLIDRGIEGARPGSFVDAYFFSVQTMATIGYGKMTPSTTLANLVVSVEALFGLVFLALATGLVFAKFSQPRARVLFSRFAVVSHRDGVRSLMVRLANERASGLVEAQLHLEFVRDETTVEGESVRRFHTLRLVHPSSVVFGQSWTAVHPIDEESPLCGETSGSLAASHAELVASLVGFVESSSQTVHSRHSWRDSEILFDRRFADILHRAPDGRTLLDYSHFHDVVAVGPLGEETAKS